MQLRNQIMRMVFVFIALTFLISSASYIWMIRTASAYDVGFFWMWSPGLAAIITQLAFKSSLREFGWQLGPKKYLWIALLIPTTYATLIYTITWVTGLAEFQKPSTNLLIAIVPGFILYCLSALGEEIGWRGFLVPHLLKITSFNRTVFITWIVWALWHYPAIIWADYNSGAPPWFDLMSLTIAIIGLSALTAWLRVKSGSLWPPVIWHAAHNLLVLAVYPAMTIRSDYSKYIISDFGIGVMLTGILLALVFTRKGNDSLSVDQT